MSNDQWANRVLEAVNKLANSPSNSWNQAANYAALPDPATCAGTTWLVLSGTGIWPVNKPSGWYASNGNAWLFLGAYNPVVTGGNVAVLNFPTFGSTAQGFTVVIPADSGVQILAADDTRKGFVVTVKAGLVYVGIGFTPTPSQYTYRLTNNSVLEKDGYTGPVYAVAADSPKDIYITEIK